MRFIDVGEVDDVVKTQESRKQRAMRKFVDVGEVDDPYQELIGRVAPQAPIEQIQQPLPQPQQPQLMPTTPVSPAPPAQVQPTSQPSALEGFLRGGLEALTIGSVSAPEVERAQSSAYLAGQILGGVASLYAAGPILGAVGVGIGSAAAGLSRLPWAMRSLEYGKKIPHATKIGGAIARGVATTTQRALGLAKPTTGFWPTVGEVAKTSATHGSLYAYNKSQQEGLDRILDAAKGGAESAVFGMGLYGLGKAVGGTGKYIYRRFKPESPVQRAYDILFEGTPKQKSEAALEAVEILRTDNGKNFLDINPDARIFIADVAQWSKNLQTKLTEIQKDRIAATKDLFEKGIIDHTTNRINLPETVNAYRQMAKDKSQDLFTQFIRTRTDFSDDVYRDMNELLKSESAKHAFDWAKTFISDIASNVSDDAKFAYRIMPNESGRWKNVPIQLTGAVIDHMYKYLGEMMQKADSVSYYGLSSVKRSFEKIIKKHMPDYKEALNTYRFNVIPADMLEGGVAGYKAKTFDEMKFQYDQLIEKNKDMYSKEKLTQWFKEGFSSEVMQLSGSDDGMNKLNKLLSAPDFQKKFDFVFGSDASNSLSHRIQLHEKVKDMLRYTNLGDVMKSYKGPPEFDYLSAIGVPSTDYRAMLSAINLGRRWLRYKDQSLPRLEEISNVMLLSENKKNILDKMTKIANQPTYKYGIPATAASKAGVVLDVDMRQQ